MPPLKHLLRLGRAYRGYVGRQVECSYYPTKLWLEPTDVCNLRCVMCPQSVPKPFKKGYMDFDLFTKIIDEAKDFAYEVNLFHRGESLIHPRLADMVSYVKKSGLHARLNTNGSLLDEAKSTALVEAGLDFISFSFDGYTSEVYDKIRVLGKFERTVEKIVSFLEVKKRLQRKTPYVALETIDFTVGPHTASDLERQQAFRARFDGLPLDRFIVKRPHNWAGTYAPGDPAVAGKPHGYSPCTFPWYALVIFWDGTVSPCPQDWYGDLDLGNASEKSLAEIWNGPKMLSLRTKMKTQSAHDLSPCKDCDMLWRPTLLGVPTSHMKNFLKENVLGYTQ